MSSESSLHQQQQQQQQRSSSSLRKRRLLNNIRTHWKVAAAATSLAAALSMSVATAFLPSIPTNNHRLMSRIPRHVVTDADTLLLESIRGTSGSSRGSAVDASNVNIYNSSRQRNVERLFQMSPDGLHELESLNNNNDEQEDVRLSNENEQLATSEAAAASSNKKKKKRISMTKKRKKATSSTTAPKRKSRSSTMPGFQGVTTDNQKAFRDGIRIVEERTGRKFVDSPEKSRQRRRSNGQDMYKNSAAVPDSLVQFADEIHREDRISRSEEIELGEKTQEAIRLQNLYDSLEEKLQREPTDDEWCAAAGRVNMEAIRQAIEEGIEAKNKLVTSNLRMVQSVVNTYIRNGLSAQYNAGDLVQEGILALIRAAEKFEPSRGFKFSTYAMYWVRASVKRSQIYQSRVITVPQRLYENHKRLVRIEKEMTEAAGGKKPSRKELGQAVGMTELQVNRCFDAMSQRIYSLDSQIHNSNKPQTTGDDSKETLVEIVKSTAIDSENNSLPRLLLREDLIETLNRHLTPKEVQILLLRYGLCDDYLTNEQQQQTFNGGRQITIAELSRIVGLKPDKVRRMINNSLKQLSSVGMDEWLAFERELQ